MPQHHIYTLNIFPFILSLINIERELKTAVIPSRESYECLKMHIQKKKHCFSQQLLITFMSKFNAQDNDQRISNYKYTYYTVC